jgi:EAL domain-containing protein (putative c-di-GMP-specific phosphodiesterase class I)
MKSSLLDHALKPDQLSVRFQPIFHIKAGVSRIDSLEALIRGPRGTNFERADFLFDYVRRKKAEATVDRRCIVAILNAVMKLPSHLRININVHASTLGKSPGFVDFFQHEARKRSLALNRFTVEIVEHAPTYNVPGLVHTIEALRHLDVRIALDDVGLGHSNYRMMLDCRPDYFKLDEYFARGVHQDADRGAVVHSIITLAESLGGCVVAEGIESKEGLATVACMGVELFQANLLCPAMSNEDLRASGLMGSPSCLPLAGTQAMGKGNSGDFERGGQRLLILRTSHSVYH